LTGIAYILKLLDQNKQFDSLHWFEEVQKKYSEERKAVQAQMSKQKKDEQTTSMLTVQRLKSYETEFALLRFSFNGARIFFNDR
jgi:WASH complex subunit 7